MKRIKDYMKSIFAKKEYDKFDKNSPAHFDSDIAHGGSMFMCFLAKNEDDSIYMYVEAPKRNDKKGVWTSDKTSFLVTKDSKMYEHGFEGFRKLKNINKLKWENDPKLLYFTLSDNIHDATINLGIRNNQYMYVLTNDMTIISYRDLVIDLKDLDIYKKMFKVCKVDMDYSNNMYKIELEK